MKSQKNQKKRGETQIGVLLEDLDSKLDIVVEGQGTLDKKVDDFRLEVDGKFKDVDYKFEIVFDELRLIRNDLKEKVSREELILLEKRVARLEKTRR